MQAAKEGVGTTHTDTEQQQQPPQTTAHGTNSRTHWLILTTSILVGRGVISVACSVMSSERMRNTFLGITSSTRRTKATSSPE